MEDFIATLARKAAEKRASFYGNPYMGGAGYGAGAGPMMGMGMGMGGMGGYGGGYGGGMPQMSYGQSPWGSHYRGMDPRMMGMYQSMMQPGMDFANMQNRGYEMQMPGMAAANVGMANAGVGNAFAGVHHHQEQSPLMGRNLDLYSHQQEQDVAPQTAEMADYNQDWTGKAEDKRQVGVGQLQQQIQAQREAEQKAQEAYTTAVSPHLDDIKKWENDKYLQEAYSHARPGGGINWRGGWFASGPTEAQGIEAKQKYEKAIAMRAQLEANRDKAIALAQQSAGELQKRQGSMQQEQSSMAQQMQGQDKTRRGMQNRGMSDALNRRQKGFNTTSGGLQNAVNTSSQHIAGQGHMPAVPPLGGQQFGPNVAQGQPPPNPGAMEPGAVKTGSVRLNSLASIAARSMAEKTAATAPVIREVPQPHAKLAAAAVSIRFNRK